MAASPSRDWGFATCFTIVAFVVGTAVGAGWTADLVASKVRARDARTRILHGNARSCFYPIDGRYPKIDDRMRGLLDDPALREDALDEMFSEVPAGPTEQTWTIQLPSRSGMRRVIEITERAWPSGSWKRTWAVLEDGVEIETGSRAMFS